MWMLQDFQLTASRMILSFVAELSMKKLGLLLSYGGQYGPMSAYWSQCLFFSMGFKGGEVGQ